MKRATMALLSLSYVGAGSAFGCSLDHGPARSVGAVDRPAEMGDSSPDAGAIANAYAVLTAGKGEELPAVIQSLDALVAAEPNNQQAVFYSGAFRFWQLAENPPPGLDEVEKLATAETTLTRLDLAHSLAPDDDIALGFDGLANALIGRQLGEPTKVDAGIAELDEGIARLPAYTHFLRALVAADQQDFAAAVGHMYGTIEACGGPSDGGVFPYASGPQEPSRAACNDEGVVPHVFEGFSIAFGDFLLRAGWDADTARRAYQSAKSSPAYGQWPFAADLDLRIEQANQEASAVADAGGAQTDGGVSLWTSSGHMCTGCHQRGQ